MELTSRQILKKDYTFKLSEFFGDEKGMYHTVCYGIFRTKLVKYLALARLFEILNYRGVFLENAMIFGLFL